MILNHVKNTPLAKDISRDLAPELLLDSKIDEMEFVTYTGPLLVKPYFVQRQLMFQQFVSPEMNKLVTLITKNTYTLQRG